MIVVLLKTSSSKSVKVKAVKTGRFVSIDDLLGLLFLKGNKILNKEVLTIRRTSTVHRRYVWEIE